MHEAKKNVKGDAERRKKISVVVVIMDGSYKIKNGQFRILEE